MRFPRPATALAATAAMTGSLALGALQPLAAHATTPTASAWAAAATPDPWVNQSDTMRFYVSTPTITAGQVGSDAVISASVNGLDCAQLAVGQSGPSGWKTPATSAKGCANDTEQVTIRITSDMVGSTLSLHGWADAQGTTTVNGTVTIGDTTLNASSYAKLPTTSSSTPSASATPSASSSPSATSTPSATATSTPSATATSTTTTTSPSASSTTAPASSTPVTPAPAPVKASTPSVTEEFDWKQGTTNDGTFRIAGDWTGTGGNQLLRSNTSLSNGVLSMTSRANTKSGAELQSVDGGHGVGYHEATLKASDVPGVLNSFFFISDGYKAPEVDMEILTKDNTATAKHVIYLTVHQGNGQSTYQQVELPFNPADGFHRYGMLLGTTSVSFYADGKLIDTMGGLATNLGGSGALHGYLMSNTWAENSSWMGPLPTQDATMQLASIKIWDGATSAQG